jgi:hypothetical protein
MGAAFGIAAGGLSIALAPYFPAGASVAQTMGFGFSALIVLFLILGHQMPVQHHVTLAAGLAAVRFLPVLAGQLRVGAEWTSAYGWWRRGTTHIDPPAMAIWIGNTSVVGGRCTLRQLITTPTERVGHDHAGGSPRN